MISQSTDEDRVIKEALTELKDHLLIMQNIERNILRLKEKLEYDDFHHLSYTIRSMSYRCKRAIEPLEEYKYVIGGA